MADQFLDWLRPASGWRWLDAGCGTGELSAAILDQAEPIFIKGIDPSQRYIEHARSYIQDPRVTFEVGEAQALSVSPASFDAAVSGLALNFLPQPEKATGEFKRAVRPGGFVAAYVWDYSGRMQMLRHFWDAAIELDPQAAALDEGRCFPICHPDSLANLYRTAGLKDVKVDGLEIPTPFKDFEDFWKPLLGGQGPAAGYIASLREENRLRLRDHLQARLKIALDGSISLRARAWAVQGRVS